MAGTLTHFYVMREYLAKIEGFDVDGEFTFAKEGLEDEQDALDEQFNQENIQTLERGGTLPPKPDINEFRTSNDKYSAAFLGSTGPDIFYMPTIKSFTSGKKLFHLSDYMHYKNGALFVKNLYEYAQNMTNEADREHVVWLCKGFLSHIATDLVIHPFVNSLVGKYQEHIIQEVNVPGIQATLHRVEKAIENHNIKAKAISYVADIVSSEEAQEELFKWSSTKTSSLAFYAHNLIEMGQDYYVMHELWDKLNIDGREVLLTHRIKGHIDILAKAFSSALTKTYNPIEKLEDYETDIANYLDYFVSTASGITLNLYPDIVLNGKYAYENAIKHKGGGAKFKKFTERAVLLTHEMISLMEKNEWDDLLTPWNLDTGLKTECKVEENEIKIDFKNYDKVFMS